MDIVTEYANIALTPEFKTKIAFTEILAGEDDNRETIVFLHGLSSSKESLLNTVVAEIYERAIRNGLNMRLIAFDWPGHGASSNELERYTFKTLADTLKKMLEFMNVEKCHLYGMSLGGMVAVKFTAENQETVKNLYIQGAPVSAKLWGRKGEAVRRSLRFAERLRITPPNSLDFLPDRLVPLLAYINPLFKLSEKNLKLAVENVPDAREMFLKNANQLSPRAFLGYADEILNAELKPELEAIHENGNRVLIIDGDKPEHPALDTMEYIKSCIPDAGTLVLKDAGHIATMIYPDVIAEGIIEHLKNGSN